MLTELQKVTLLIDITTSKFLAQLPERIRKSTGKWNLKA